MSPRCPYLFVYGTLRRSAEHPMSDFLARNARLVGRAKAPGRLYDLGLYPGMVEPADSDEWVRGELFLLDDPERTLAELDPYEGCGPEHKPPYLFERCMTEAILDTGERHRAWVYFYRRDVCEEQRILSGEYSPSARSQ